MAKKQEAPAEKKPKKQHKVKAPKPLLSKAARLAVESIRQTKTKVRESRKAVLEKMEAAKAEAERRRVLDACNNWIGYWKCIVLSKGFCQLESFDKPQPEVVMAIDRLFNYGGHNDPRPGIEMLIGEEYFGKCVDGRYFIAHNEMVDASVVEE